MGFLMLRVRSLFASVLAVGLAACGGHSSPGSPTPPTAAPQITCPTDVAVSGVAAASQKVEYPAPVVTGGTAPVQTACNPASGASFPLGSTAVSCTASDASSRSATCSFRVVLTGLSIAATKFEAFGDSITAGETGHPNLLGFDNIDIANSYPTKLQQSLDAAHPGQGIVVLNQGQSGARTDAVAANIQRRVPVDRPEVVLLLAGYNDLTQGCGTGSAATPLCRDAIRGVGIGIRDCLKEVREANGGVRFIFVSTLTPPGPTGSNRINRDAIVQANDQIRQFATGPEVTVVDAYTAFIGHESDYVNNDGLHLKPEGYQALADTFFAAIQATVPQTPLFR